MWQRVVQALERVHLQPFPPSDFGWGVDYLTSESVANPQEFLEHYVQGVLSDTAKYFAYKARGAFTVRGNLLSFPAPLTYPGQPEANRTTYARVFPATRSKKAIIVVPHWNASPESYAAMCRALARFGYTAVRLSLPYHQERGVGDWQVTNDLVSANLGRTLQGVRQAVIEVRAIVDWLQRQGYERIGIFGSSLGHCIAVMAQAHERAITSLFAVHMSAYFGDVVWTGRSTQHIRLGLEGYVTQDELRRYWLPISTASYLQRFQGRDPHHFAITGRYDVTFLHDLTEELFAEYTRCGVPVTRKLMPAGHFTFRYPPLSYFIFGLMLKHFRATL